MERYALTKNTLLLGGMVLLSAALSYFFFAGQSLRLDEAQSLWQSSRSAGDILTIVSQDVHVPLYEEILHFWRLYIGDSVTSGRLLSLLFFLCSIPAIYALGKLAYNRTIGLFGALLLCISPFMNWYGNEIRMYTLFALMVILNQYFYLRIFKAPERLPREHGPHDGAAWVGYAVTAVIGAFVHYFFFLNLLAQAIFYFFEWRRFPKGSFVRFLITAGLVLAAFAPWAWYVWFQGQAQNQQPLLPIPSSVNLFSTFSQFLFGFQSDNINTIFLSLWPVTIIFGFLTLRRSKRLSPVSEYFMLTILLSVGLAFFVSFIVPVFVSRYLIFTVPSLYLLLLSLFSNYAPRPATIARWGLVAVMFVTLGVEIISPTTPVKENYREAADYIANNATAQDIIILSAPFSVYPVQYYYRGPAPIATIPMWDQYAYGPIPPFVPDQLPSQVAQLTQDHQNVWLLLSYDQGYQKQVQAYFDGHFQRLAAKNFSPGLDLYTYKIRYDTKISQATTTAALKRQSPASN